MSTLSHTAHGAHLLALAQDMCAAAKEGDAARMRSLDNTLRSEAMAFMGTMPLSGDTAEWGLSTMGEVIDCVNKARAEMQAHQQRLHKARDQDRRIRLVYSRK